MSNNVKQKPTKVITGKNTRWSYANVWEAKANAEGQTPKFSVSLIIPKDDVATIAKIKAAIKAAYDEGQSKLKGNAKTVPALNLIKNPLRDGDVERPDDEAYANSYFINANSVTAPGIVDADCNPILMLMLIVILFLSILKSILVFMVEHQFHSMLLIPMVIVASHVALIIFKRLGMVNL